MSALDRRFKAHKARYMLQSVLAAVPVFVMIMILDPQRNAVVIAAVGASSFIAFTMPGKQVSRARFLLGGHFVAGIIAMSCDHLAGNPSIAAHLTLFGHPETVFALASVILTIFAMTITNTEHPPAVSLAFGLVFQKGDPATCLIALACIAAVVGVSRLLRRFLISLV